MLQPITFESYKKIRKWRNLPEVRSMMFTKHVISEEEHDNWWEKIRNDDTKKWLMYSFNGTDLGVVCFYDINFATKTAEWGFYLAGNDLFEAQKISKKRIWIELEKEAIEYAKHSLCIETLFCEVLDENTSVIKLHEKVGFSECNNLNGGARFQLQFSPTKTHG